MAAVQIIEGSAFPMNELLDSIANLDITELEHFQQGVNLVVARKRAASLMEQESVLLQKINMRINPVTKTAYEILHKKMQEETITVEEHKELLQLVDQLESANADWLKNMIELAQLWGISPQELMNRLNINPKYAAKKDS